MNVSSLGPLVLVPTLRGERVADGRIVVTRKFVDGVSLYARYWPGPVRVVLHPAEGPGTNLDNAAVDPADLAFGMEIQRFDSPGLRQKLAGAELVLGGPNFRMPDLWKICREMEVPCVHITEYSLRTRLQIRRIDNKDPIRLMRGFAWELNQERLIRRSIRRSAGVQCNGTPTYDAYRRLSPNALLYFDTRTDESSFATEEEMGRREARLRAQRPLTLGFSGRLIKMKGAEDVVEVASQLKRRGFPFRFVIAGDGVCAPAMRERIQREGLAEVEMRGVLDFRTELMPLMRSEVDVFVACHRQGDPSCTYLETLSAGVPIVGYENEAFQGLLRQAPIGVGVRLGRPDRVADAIASLDRTQMIAKGREGLRFAREHSFERTFTRRVDHLVEIARRWREEKRRPDVA